MTTCKLRIRPWVPILLVALFVCLQDHAKTAPLSDQLDRVLHAWQATAKMRNDRLLASAGAFESSVRQFLSSPNRDNQSLMQASWRQAHRDFLAARMFFVGQTADLMFRLDAWPIEEGFLDSVADHPTSGIVNDFAINIDPATLINQHGITDEQEVSLGFHAAEYFVFARPLADFVPDTADRQSTISRRRDALGIITELLLLDLEQMVELGEGRLRTLEKPSSPAAHALADSLRASIRRLHDEADLLFNRDIAHSRFSGSSREDFKVEVESMRQIVGDPVLIINLLLDSHPGKAETFFRTLSELIEIAGNEPKQRTRIPGLLATLMRQITEMEQRLPPER